MEQAAVEEWKNYMKQYESSKNNLQWEHTAPPKPVKHSDVWRQETQYNPILQTYTAPQVETELRQQERERLIMTLSQNKDRALRYEQTFNVINLQDKLQGLEGLPGYPVPQSEIKTKQLPSTHLDYNLISGLDFSEHSHLPPAQRPLPRKEPPRTYKLNAVEFRDFDIISNKYLKDHEVHTLQDRENYRKQAATNYWRTHEYDAITAQLYDPDAEAAFQCVRHQHALCHGQNLIEKLPQGVKYSEGALYQPINMRVVDAERLQEIDLKQKQSKQRYETRYELEKEYRDRDVMVQERARDRTLNRLSHNRHTETVERGYNILSNAAFRGMNAETKPPPLTKPPTGLWARTLAQSRPSTHQSGVPSRGSIRSSGFQIVS